MRPLGLTRWLCEMLGQVSGVSVPTSSGRRKARWRLLRMVLGWAQSQSELVDRKWCLKNTPMKADALFSWLAAPQLLEHPRNYFPKTSQWSCTPGGACAGDAEPLVVSDKAKFPSGMKTCCSWPVYNNNLPSGAWYCQRGRFYYPTKAGTHGAKCSPWALSITKQPDPVSAPKHPLALNLFSINFQRNDQSGRGGSRNANDLLSGFPAGLDAPKSPPSQRGHLVILLARSCLWASASPHRQMGALAEKTTMSVH